MNLLFRPQGVRRGPALEAIQSPWVLIVDGRVVHCDSFPPDGIPERTGEQRGGWLIEPLADAHVHLFLPGSLDRLIQKQAAELPRDEALARILKLLRDYRAAGVAAVRDGGDPSGLALEAARVANGRPDLFAAVLPAGEPIFRRGRYGSFLGQGVDSVVAAERKILRNRAEGATHVKILATGINSLEKAGAIGGPQFTPDEFSEIVDCARRVGMDVMVHANGSIASWGCVPKNGHSLEHGFLLEAGDLGALAAGGTAWVPTLGAWEELARRPQLEARQRAVIAETAQRHREEVARGHALGIRIVCGTDAGSPGVSHCGGLAGEIGKLSEVLLGRAQPALASSCYRARKLCEKVLGRSLGGLDVGESAGFVWVKDDPVRDLATLGSPRGVFLGGKWSDASNREKGKDMRSEAT